MKAKFKRGNSMKPRGGIVPAPGPGLPPPAAPPAPNLATSAHLSGTPFVFSPGNIANTQVINLND